MSIQEEILKKVNKIYGKYMATQGLPVWGSTTTVAQSNYRVLLTDSSGQLLISAIASSVDISDRWSRQLGEIDIERYLGLAIGLSNPLHDQIVVGGAVIDPRSIRALTSADVVSVNNFANPLPTLVQYPSGTTIDPRSIRTLTSSDIITAYGNLGALQQRVTSLDLYAALRYAGSEIDPRSIRALTSSDIVTTLVNYPSGTLIDPRSIRALVSSDVITVYGSQTQALLQRASTYDLQVQLRTAGTEYDARSIRTLTSSDIVTALINYPSGTLIDPRAIRALTSSDIVTSLINYPSGTLIDPRSIRALTSSDVVSVYNFANPLPTLVQYPSGTTIDPRSIRTLTSSDIVTALINYPSGTLIDPRSIRTLTPSDIVTVLVNYPSGTLIDPRAIRALTSSDVVSVYNFANPLPVSESGSWTVTATQSTRTSLLVKPEREDLTGGEGGTYSPNNAGVQVIAGVSGKYIKVFAAGYEILAAGLHYFYYGTSTTPPTLPSPKAFLLGSAVGRNRQTFTNPMNTGAAGDSLYIYSIVSETNMPVDVQAVVE
jgi:hypothetical protein